MSARAGRFQRDVGRLLVTFFAVALIDLVVVSLLSGRLRVWFPVWLDPDWATRSDPWVVYSQSYIAGIALIPVLVWVLDREFLAGRSTTLRGGVWAVCLLLLGFIGWWKGDLMVTYDKEREGLGWLALTVIVWGLVALVPRLADRLTSLSRRRVLRGLVTGLGVFFVAMAVVDPALQVGVHGLDWSSGLLIEMGFFVPAGIAMWVVRRRLAEPAEST